jgi:N-acetylglucosaminyldiphosphoundecaprenol N-acetyl-beta-D-mannosaminyltransferase
VTPEHPPTPDSDFTRILGIRFFTGSVERLLALASQGGLFVFPSGPGLAELDRDPVYRDALERSDVAVTDSGAMVLLWFLRTGQRVNRISGLRFLRALLAHPDVRRPNCTFWIMPSEREAAANLEWLNAHGIPTTHDDIYLAPRYGAGAISDPDLVAAIERGRPRYVVLCIGGGTQEPLGLALREALNYRPAILCTGAAIAFLTGQQAPIPVWADRLMLGWLVRSLSAPRRFIPRYARALRLVPLLLRYGSDPVRD